MALEPETNKPARRFRYSDESAVTPVVATAAATATATAPAPALATSAPDEYWRWVWIALVGVGAAMAYFYSTTLEQLTSRWMSDAGWSHGFVVPLISLYFIRNRWDILERLEPKGSLLGAVVLGIGVCGQVLFRATGLEHMSLLSMPLILFGVVLFIFGWEYLKVLWLPIGFLIFALPPPQTLYVKLTMPMQEIAAELGVQLLPLFGADAVRHGTIIDLTFGHEVKQLNVEQACSGMRLLVAFFALAVALGYSTNRPMWQKVTLAVCALPIAILCNGLRVTGTGVLVGRVGEQWGQGDAHGFFGLTMLIPAMLLQLLVAWILDRIFVETPEKKAEGSAA